jgi:hypothetical protein
LAMPDWSPPLHRVLVVAIHSYIPASLPDAALPKPLHVPRIRQKYCE